MKYLYVTITLIACFAIKADAQMLNTQPKSFDLDKLRTDTLLVQGFLKRNPDMFKAQPDLVVASSTNLLVRAFTDHMPVAKLSSKDKMPVAHVSSDDRMPILKIQTKDPQVVVNP